MNSNDNGQLNLDWSAALVAGLAAAGVADIVLSPGSRSTPLALACLRHPALRCDVILDERSAAWFALGRAKAERRPVALVCTSGTAAANWLPAVVEANHAGVPLLLLSADRPPELQACGANQTIDQTQLFAGQVRASHAPGAPFAGFDARWLHQLAARAVAESRWPLPGPVHINLAFREPLLPTDPAIDYGSGAVAVAVAVAETPMAPPVIVPDAGEVATLAARLSGRRGVIVCGGMPPDGDVAAAVSELAAALACPILADPHSGLRFGGHVHDLICCRHELWLKDAAKRRELAPEWLLRFGAFPVTRALQGFVADCGETYLVESHGRWPDPLHRTQRLLRGDAAAVCRALAAQPLRAVPAGWLAAFAAAEAAVTERATASELPAEARLLAGLAEQLPAGTKVFCGNSLPIRDLAAWSGKSETPLVFYANRGASGIDGNLATAAGIAVSGPTVAVVGDLTAQHDLGSLALMRGKPLVVVVINNGGGGIFDFLPQKALPEFEAGWLTPQAIDFAHAAAAFGVDFMHTGDVDAALTAALAALADGQPRLIELVVDREESLRLRQAW